MPAPGSRPRPADLLRQALRVLQEAAAGFNRNGDLRQASGLAFYTALALIPALLLLTGVLGLAIGGSQEAHRFITGFLASLVPDQAERVLAEVGALTRHPGTAGALNVLVLAWSVTPLVSALRASIGTIFMEPDHRAIWITKLLDLAAAMAALTALAALAAASVLRPVLNRALPGQLPSLGFLLPFAVTTGLVLGVHYLFSPKAVRLSHRLAGALATACLWFLLRPAFTLFLAYNPSYGLAFGSFKSLFLILVWIYVSMAILLLGVEVAAACHRRETVAIRRLLTGGGAAEGGRFLMEAPAGHVFFREGEPGTDMFHVLQGSVAILKHGHELARIGPGRSFGEMTFLLGMDRSATATALEPCRCVVVNSLTFNRIQRDYPDTVRVMLVEMAARLRETSDRAEALGVGAESKDT